MIHRLPVGFGGNVGSRAAGALLGGVPGGAGNAVRGGWRYVPSAWASSTFVTASTVSTSLSLSSTSNWIIAPMFFSRALLLPQNSFLLFFPPLILMF
ncbi:MAG: hypothetical protein FWC64_12985 [Treponema sp.]|nr:hypothetical protein [Treponema sp.]